VRRPRRADRDRGARRSGRRRTRTHLGTASFDSPEALAATEVEGSPLAPLITPEVYDRIRAGTRDVLTPFTGPDGRVAAPLRGHVVVAARTPEG